MRTSKTELSNMPKETQELPPCPSWLKDAWIIEEAIMRDSGQERLQGTMAREAETEGKADLLA